LAFATLRLIYFAFAWGLQSQQILLNALKDMTNSCKHIHASTFTHINSCVVLRRITIVYMADSPKVGRSGKMKFLLLFWGEIFNRKIFPTRNKE